MLDREAFGGYGQEPLSGFEPEPGFEYEYGPGLGSKPGFEGQWQIRQSFLHALRAPDEALEAALDSISPDGFGYDGAAELLVGIGKLSSWLDGLKAQAVNQLAETSAQVVPQKDPAGPRRNEKALAKTVAEAEVMAALTLSDSAAKTLIAQSSELVDEYPATLGKLRAGQLHRAQAEVIVEQGSTIPETGRKEFEAQLLDAATRVQMPRPNLNAKARRLREKLHPESIKKRRQKAACDRRVDIEPREDGTAYLGAYLPAEAAVAAYNRVTTAARTLQGPEEARTLTQLRADVFADLLLVGGFLPEPVAATDVTAGSGNTGNRDEDRTGQNGNGSETSPADAAADCAGAGGVGDGMPHYGRIKAEVIVTVPVLTLLGHTDEPAELEGFGPMDAETARKLAAGATSFKRILTHPETGAMLSFGRDAYKVPSDLKKMINIRDRCCRGVGCNRSAKFCDLDHTLPWGELGQTDYENVKNLCKRTHLLKTAGGWKDKQLPEGIIEWTSPAGRKYRTEPEGPVMSGRDDAGRHQNPEHGHHFDPWDPKNLTQPAPEKYDNPPPF